MNLTEDDVRVMRQQNDLKAFIKDQIRAAQTAHGHRRGLVLAHPDLAARLTEPPLAHTTPEHWTGYVPPATTCTGAINPSPIRAQLAAIVTEATVRARAQETAA